MRQIAVMKNKNYKSVSSSSHAEEPMVGYSPTKRTTEAMELDFKDFEKIASKTDFTQKEWADILHISERTIQRYAKENGTFNPNVSDKIYHINKVINRGQEVFGSYEKFLLWLRESPNMLEGHLSLNSLSNADGIQLILTQLGRIEHGILS